MARGEIIVPGNVKINSALIHDIIPSKEEPWRARIDFSVFLKRKRLTLDVNLAYVDLGKLPAEPAQ